MVPLINNTSEAIISRTRVSRRRTSNTVIKLTIVIATKRSFSDTLYIKLLGRALIKYSTYSITENKISTTGGIRDILLLKEFFGMVFDVSIIKLS